MLTAPQQQSDQLQHISFDSTNFRTGLTPRSGMTPRTGLTPGTGFTPLVGGPVAFPTSPSTATFMALMNNSSVATNTITPNTLNAITGALNSVQHGAPNSYPPQQQDPNRSTYPVSASTAANNAANGLFLLSQAHQELTKREEAQARAGNATLNGANGVLAHQNGKRLKRKSYDNISPPPSALEFGQARASKRTRSTAHRKGSERGGSEGMDEEDDNEDVDDVEDIDQGPPPPARKGLKKLETEEEKRRNFLERNRQGDSSLSSVVYWY